MLKKFFIKNYEDVDNPTVRNKYGIVAGTFGVISNLILGIIKLIIGFISNSVSIMADAVNNLSDTASSMLTMLGFKLSNKKPDNKHPYGYARYEYVVAFVISLFMLVMGIIFAKESIIKILKPEEIIINVVTFTVLIIAILVKTCQMFVYLDFSKTIKSNTLKTNAIDTKNDIVSTTAILISMIAMEIFNINIDGYLGTVVSAFVIYSSICMVKDVLKPIIGIAPDEKQVNKIKEKLLSYECVKGIHDLVIHNYGANNDFVTVHIEIDASMNILEAHDLMDVIENDFKEDLGLNLTIHMDPVIIGNKKVDEIKKLVEEAINKMDSNLQIHDFRIIEKTEEIKVLFDCVVPYDKNYTIEDITNFLQNNIKNNNYNYVIEIDRPYC